MKKNKNNTTELWVLAATAVLLVLLGAALALIYVALPADAVEPSLKKGAVIGGAAIAAIGCVMLVVSCLKISAKRRAKKASEEALREMQNQIMRQKQQEQRVIPEAAIPAVIMGEKQPIDEKFAEIAKMDKSQFVFYVARLFALKGYGIKFTAVVDNFGVDLLLQRGEKTFGAACFLSSDVVRGSEVAVLRDCREHYAADGYFAVTNMFFDRSALEVLKKCKISVIDKNVLAEEYM